MCGGGDWALGAVDLTEDTMIVSDEPKKRSLPEPLNLENAGKYVKNSNRRSRIRQNALKTKYDKTADEDEKVKACTLVNITKTHGTPTKENRVSEFVDDTIAMGMSMGEAREMMIEELGSKFEK